MLNIILFAALVILSVATLGCIYRVLVGPSMPDRVIALDVIGINLIGIVAILSVVLGTQYYLDIIVVIGVLAFLGTVAFSKYLERGVVIEHERDSADDR